MKALRGSIFVSGSLLLGIRLATAQTWTQTSAPVTNYTAITCSADGATLAAFAGGGLVYTSTNSGVTWNQSTNAPVGNLRVASSADGTILTAAVNGGGIYRSLDSGSTWTQTSALTNYWVSIASSADGNKLTALAAVFPPPDFYTSSDGGNTWQTNASPYDRWGNVACSADGNTIVACGDLGTVLTSTNFGSSWITNNFNTSFNSAASSADGTRLMVFRTTANNGTMYVSTNWGLAWNQVNTPLIGEVASSADGSTLVAVGFSGYQTDLPVYVSTNFGTTWTSNTPPGIDYWTSTKPVVSSGDGSELVAAVNGGGIWISQTTPSIVPVPNRLFSFTVPPDGGSPFTIQASTNLVDWNNVYTNLTPTFPFTWTDSNSDEFNQRFYRIKIP